MKFTTASRLSIPLILVLCFQLILPAAGYSSGKPRAGVKSAGSKSNAPAPQFKRVEKNAQTMPGLLGKVEVIEDDLGIPHIFAEKNEDAFFMEGFYHARDRFFQMDARRRQLDGTLAELLGPGENNEILESDSTARGAGLYIASQASLSKYSSEVLKFLKSYAAGVNMYLDNNPLPEEYRVLKITKARPWTELDSVYVGKGLAVSLTFDLSDLENTMMLKAYQDAGKAGGFDGAALYFQDTFRVAPFDPTFVIPDATGKPVTSNLTGESPELQPNSELRRQQRQWSEQLDRMLTPNTVKGIKTYIERMRKSPLFNNSLKSRDDRNGSNWLIVGGQHTDSGAPMLVGDQHFDLENAPTWYQIQLNVSGKGEIPLNVIGVSVAGAPGVALGHNDDIAWEATITVFDFTDVFQDRIALQLGANPIVIMHDGKKEPTILRNEKFRINQMTDGKTDNVVDVPKGTVGDQFIIVPFRNNGPIIAAPDFDNMTALVLQQPAFGPTQEIEGFLKLDRSKTLKEFQKGLQLFGAASVNMGVVTKKGEYAYFTTGELPLREDLEAGTVEGPPPFFIRDGISGKSDWQPLRKKQKNQTLPTEILPFKELPQAINPANGFIASANNDPIGSTANNMPFERKRANGGIFYLSAVYASGLRAARLTRETQAAIASGKKITLDDMRHFQGSVKMRDAEILLPSILQAFDNAQATGAPAKLAALANDAGIKEAVARFKQWDFNTPTGLRNGYDAFVPFNQSDPTQKQIDSSVATTIYSMWRSQMVRNVIDATLKPLGVIPVDGNFGQVAIGALGNLLDKFSTMKGVGVSGVSFFNVPELASETPEARRDFIILQSLRGALDELAGPDFTLAYHNSTNQLDYRWGMIHRLFIPHLLGTDSGFSIPSENGNFKSPFPGLYGIPRDGGYEVPNACSHPIRAKTQNDFLFKHSPTHRFGVIAKPSGLETVDALAGGQRADRSSKFYDDQLNLWLVVDVRPLISDKSVLMGQGAKQTLFQPK